MQKIKYFLDSQKGKDILTVIIIILVGLSSFGLGRLSKSPQNGDFRVIYPTGEEQAGSAILGASTDAKALMDKQTAQSPNIQLVNKNYVASSRGHKYYPVGCSAGDSLSEANKIYFATSDEAEKAGYTLSSSC